MNIKINKIDSHEADGNASDIISTYAVVENGRGFRITFRSNHHGRSLGFEGKDGTFYINKEDGMVHWQKVALGGGCGLIIDDEPVEGLSPLAIRGIILAEQSKESEKITITIGRSGDGDSHPVLLINGIVKDLRQYPDIFGDIAT
jgi:hypothetical protein